MCKVYVSCLSCYSNGKNHGSWFDVNESLLDSVNNLLTSCTGEEYEIVDHEGFGDFRLSEFASLTKAIEIAEKIEEFGEVFTHVLTYTGGNIEDAVSIIEEKSSGVFDSKMDWLYNFVEETGLLSGVPQIVADYFDYESYLRDIELEGALISFEVSGDYHIFLA